MAAADVQAPPAEPAPALPDYLTNPNAVLGDNDSKWRYGRAPDYSKTRKVYAETKKMDHPSGSLEEIVQNLVKNWEVEASFKPELKDWRTIDHENYSFAINGGPPQTADHMLKVGTYNAIIAPNEYYDPRSSTFASSHKTFKRMMPTFAWEVIEVYSGPPTVAFKWRHWGTMKNDYVGFNDKGEKVTVKAHGGPIDVQGVTVATVNDKVQLQKVMTWFDPMEMFRQIAPDGIVNKQIMEKKIDPATESPEHSDAETESAAPKKSGIVVPTGNIYESSITGNPDDRRQAGLNGTHKDEQEIAGTKDKVDEYLEQSSEAVHPHPHDMEDKVKPGPGQAVVAPPAGHEAFMTHEEMSKMTGMECPFMQNRE